MEFTKPVLAYAEIWPLIAVLGVACLGVLAEALLARPHRHRAQVLLAGTGLVAALVGTVVVGTRVDLPFLPDLLGAGEPSFALDAAHSVPVGRYQEVSAP